MPTNCSSPSAIPSAPTHRRVSSRVALLALVAALTIIGLVAAWRAPDAAAVEMPAVNGRVMTIAPDGAGGVYSGGAFTEVGGLDRRYAAHILADGTVAPAWQPDPDGFVRAIAVYGTTVYMGGDFLTVGGASMWLNHSSPGPMVMSAGLIIVDVANVLMLITVAEDDAPAAAAPAKAAEAAAEV